MSLLANDIAVALVDDSFIFSTYTTTTPLIVPAYVAIQTGTAHVLACGEEARAMLGREPENITVVKVLEEGGLTDCEAASSLFRYGLKTLQRSIPALFRPRVIIALKESSPVKYSVKQMAVAGGARDVFLINMGMATAIGMQLDVERPKLKAVLSVSDDWFEFSIISLAGKLVGITGHIGVEAFVEDIRNHIILVRKFRPDFSSLREQLLRQGLSVCDPVNIPGWETWAGKTETGRLSSQSITQDDLTTGMLPSLICLTEKIKEAIRKLPQEKQYQLSQTTIHGAGSAMKIPGFAEAISNQIGFSCVRFSSACHPAIDGARQVLKEMKFLKILNRHKK